MYYNHNKVFTHKNKKNTLLQLITRNAWKISKVKI